METSWIKSLWEISTSFIPIATTINCTSLGLAIFPANLELCIDFKTEHEFIDLVDLSDSNYKFDFELEEEKVVYMDVWKMLTD